MFDYNNIRLQYISPTWLPGTIQAAMLRLDLLHGAVSGNKWFKLQCNVAAAKAQGREHIVTFGGAYSNHLAATAAACQLLGIRCTAVVRGAAAPELSHTLQLAQQQGMQLHFVTREAYRDKETTDWTSLFPNAYIVPEGGHNAAGAKGCEEILSLKDCSAFTHILCAVGTGTTLAGLINSAQPQQQLKGYVVLKGASYLEHEVRSLLLRDQSPQWELVHEHHGGGYAKVKPELIAFMNQFYEETQIPLDIVYTGKLVQGFKKDLESGVFPPGSRVLLIHSGGLQGNLSLKPGELSY
ncbi:1-aminocyclopropane-1-carboxylate deaminase/D-cysteine desulfhydrase [Chitinophaga sancti]|uniref:1-aminocyclopropane-1-carboxylate deaminase/D-cysteine desulfhydrase n=1 Tax=Chitinophaga sancti TaxID=1004 RepID=UPI003F79EF8E